MLIRSSPKARSTVVNDESLGKRLLRSYLMRSMEKYQAVIDVAPVFGKRYAAAVEALEEIEQLIDELAVL